MTATGLVDSGVLLVIATALIWPAAATLHLVLRRQARVAAWVVFLRVGLAAVGAAALLFGLGLHPVRDQRHLAGDGVAGPPDRRADCLGGAVLCGLAAVVLRLSR
jgi:hypothetical protein